MKQHKCPQNTEDSTIEFYETWLLFVDYYDEYYGASMTTIEIKHCPFCGLIL